jgi:uncharacterized protein with HEPN domain
MPRSVLAYLSDIIEACDSVQITLAGVDIDAYLANRTVRSAVERELAIVEVAR